MPERNLWRTNKCEVVDYGGLKAPFCAPDCRLTRTTETYVNMGMIILSTTYQGTGYFWQGSQYFTMYTYIIHASSYFRSFGFRSQLERTLPWMRYQMSSASWRMWLQRTPKHSTGTSLKFHHSQAFDNTYTWWSVGLPIVSKSPDWLLAGRPRGSEFQSR